MARDTKNWQADSYAIFIRCRIVTRYFLHLGLDAKSLAIKWEPFNWLRIQLLFGRAAGLIHTTLVYCCSSHANTTLPTAYFPLDTILQKVQVLPERCQWPYTSCCPHPKSLRWQPTFRHHAVFINCRHKCGQYFSKYIFPQPGIHSCLLSHTRGEDCTHRTAHMPQPTWKLTAQRHKQLPRHAAQVL